MDLSPIRVGLPTLRRSRGASVRRVSYLLVVPPFPARARGFGQLSTEEAERYRSWLDDTEARRVPLAVDVFTQLGVDLEGLPDDLAKLDDLQKFVLTWYPQLLQEGVKRINDALGGVSDSRELGTMVVDSLVHDIGFIVVHCARRTNPSLRWLVDDRWFTGTEPPRSHNVLLLDPRFDRVQSPLRVGAELVQLAGALVRDRPRRRDRARSRQSLLRGNAEALAAIDPDDYETLLGRLRVRRRPPTALLAGGEGAEVPLPCYSARGAGGETTVMYQISEVPGGMLSHARPRSVVADYVAWLKSVEAERTRYAVGVFERLGLIADHSDPQWIAALGKAVFAWYPEVVAPYIGGLWLVAPASGMLVPGPLHSPRADALVLSLAVDLGLVVAAAAREKKPGLEWQVAQVQLYSATRRQVTVYASTLNAAWGDQADPVHTSLLLLLSATSQLFEFRIGSEAQDAYPSSALARCYEDIFRTDTPPVADVGRRSSTAVPRVWKSRFARLRAPLRGRPTFSAEAVVAVGAFRRAGWFAGHEELSDEQLTARLEATLMAVDGFELPDEASELDEILLGLDAARTFGDDTEADVAEGNAVYVGLAKGLAALLGEDFRITNVKEDWADNWSVLVRFRLNGTPTQIRLRQCNDWVDPRFFTELNALLPENGPRFWFVHNGGQNAIVTRATAQERAELESSRRIRLHESPPQWWEDVCSPAPEVR